MRLRDGVTRARGHGLGEPDLRELSQIGARAASPGRRWARRHLLTHTSPGCTRPSCWSGLAAAVERLGVTIHEGTPVQRDPTAGGNHAGGDRGRAPGRPRNRGLHGQPARPQTGAPTDEQLDHHHRPAFRRRLGGDRLDWQQRRSTTPRWPTSTCSAPPTGASRSEAGECRIASAREPTGAVRLRAATIQGLHEQLLAMFPVSRRGGVDHAWSGRARRTARLVCVGRGRSGHGTGLGRWIRRRGGGRSKPRGPHAPRPNAGRAQQPDRAAVGRAPAKAMGARAHPLERHSEYLLALSPGRSRRAPGWAPIGARAAGGRPVGAALICPHGSVRVPGI